tara:strand:+ start:326 stop:976 length:651 start_codon:yes stop_codon:yes gene_type:complete
VAKAIVQKITMQDAKVKFGNLALTNYYQVNFSVLKQTITNYLERIIGLTNSRMFLSREAGILCSEASLPASAFNTSEVNDSFMGIPQEFANTRLYTDIDFTFYIDNDYSLLRVFEGWMDYISNGSEVDIDSKSYYRRFRYPDDYKVDTMSIIKFERDYGPQLQYDFKNAFPKAINSIPVSYGTADLLKVTVTFNYDRYVVNRTIKPRNTTPSILGT